MKLFPICTFLYCVIGTGWRYVTNVTHFGMMCEPKHPYLGNCTRFHTRFPHKHRFFGSWIVHKLATNSDTLCPSLLCNVFVFFDRFCHHCQSWSIKWKPQALQISYPDKQDLWVAVLSLLSPGKILMRVPFKNKIISNMCANICADTN